MDLEAIIVIIFLALLIFIGFVIYFTFKILEFVIRATNLYEKMINRQDATIKILKDIRGPGDFKKDISLDNNSNSSEKFSVSKKLIKVGGGVHHWGENDKTYDVIRKCPECGAIFHGAEFKICVDCDCELFSK